MQNDTLITSSGIIKNRFNPRSGVINANSLYDDFFQDCLNSGIDLTYESLRDETLGQIREENPELDDSELNDLVNESMEMVEFDFHVFLLGAWVKNTNGQYEIDKSGKSGKYALEYNTETGIVCVEWAQMTKWCSNTSQCYVMADGSGPCGDLDSSGTKVIAYTLPDEMLRSDNNSQN